MARRLFGTDGIRGEANKFPMTAEVALKVGMAAGKIFTNGAHRHRVVIGKDTRLSGYMIESALKSGFLSVGMDVFELGPMPTPAVAMLTRSLRADLGVMISASHNPFDDNGIKLFDPDGYKMSDETEKRIEELVDQPSSSLLVPSDTIGRGTRVESAQERYIEFAKRTLPRNLRLDGLRVVIDCANGAGYKVAPLALWELGAEVIKIGVEPNGLNINAGCGSTAPEALCAKVREVRADIGIALDGDADRVVIVDDNRGFRFAAEVFLRTLDSVEIAGTAPDGLQGLELIDRLKPDAAIVDISMPGLNGFELAARLQEQPLAPGIILVSMNVDQTTRSEALRLGVDGVVSKADFVDQMPAMLDAIFVKRTLRGEG